MPLPEQHAEARLSRLARRRPLEMRRAERATSARRSRCAHWLDEGREVERRVETAHIDRLSVRSCRGMCMCYILFGS